MFFVPTRAAARMMLALSLSWPDVVADLERVHTTIPVIGSTSRVTYNGERIQAFCEPGTHDGLPAMFVVGLRERIHDTVTIPVVGVEAPRPGRASRRGGSGSMWPSTWRALVARLEMSGCRVVRGGKHWAVIRGDKRIATLPVSSSDHRALVNACTQLRSLGIDVRRQG